MEYPGTISVRESTFQALLTDVCASYRAHGFRDIVLIGDSSGNLDGMQAVAKALNAAWAKGTARVHSIPEYYDAEWLDNWLAKEGIVEEDEDIHDCYAVSAMLVAVDPELIRAIRRQAAGKFSINGVPLAPVEKTAAAGRKLIDKYAEVTAEAIRKSIAAKRK
jgi:creatinine amidohydrolase/Fe(II)-dependent formamide hydrolase-like protein